MFGIGARRRKKREKKRKLALVGKATSGHLSEGERARLFRQRKK